MVTAALSLSLCVSLAGLPMPRPIASQIRAVARQAAAAPRSQMEWQRQRDQAEKSKERGKLWGLTGGAFALSAATVSLVCVTDSNGDCDKKSQRIATGFMIAAGVGAAVGVGGLIRYVRARGRLRELDAHPPR